MKKLLSIMLVCAIGMNVAYAADGMPANSELVAKHNSSDVMTSDVTKPKAHKKSSSSHKKSHKPVASAEAIQSVN